MEQDEMTEPGNLSQVKRNWETLLSNPCWVELCVAIQAQTDSLQQDILFSPIGDVADLYMLERKKGQLEGRLSISATAQAMQESNLMDLAQAINRKGEENATA